MIKGFPALIPILALFICMSCHTKKDHDEAAASSQETLKLLEPPVDSEAVQQPEETPLETESVQPLVEKTPLETESAQTPVKTPLETESAQTPVETPLRTKAAHQPQAPSPSEDPVVNGISFEIITHSIETAENVKDNDKAPILLLIRLLSNKDVFDQVISACADQSHDLDLVKCLSLMQDELNDLRLMDSR